MQDAYLKNDFKTFSVRRRLHDIIIRRNNKSVTLN